MERIKNSLPELSITGKLIHEINGLELCEGYAIGNDAIVYSCRAHSMSGFYFKNHWSPLKTKPHPSGYPYVIISGLNNKKYTHKIHRLMALAFIPNPNNYPVINHKDANKLNNSLSNLEWCTQKYNAIHSISLGLRNTAVGSRLPNSILTEQDIPKIFELKKSGMINREIGKIFGVETSVICRVINRQRWKHVPI